MRFEFLPKEGYLAVTIDGRIFKGEGGKEERFGSLDDIDESIYQEYSENLFYKSPDNDYIQISEKVDLDIYKRPSPITITYPYYRKEDLWNDIRKDLRDIIWCNCTLFNYNIRTPYEFNKIKSGEVRYYHKIIFGDLNPVILKAWEPITRGTRRYKSPNILPLFDFLVKNGYKGIKTETLYRGLIARNCDKFIEVEIMFSDNFDSCKLNAKDLCRTYDILSQENLNINPKNVFELKEDLVSKED